MIEWLFQSDPNGITNWFGLLVSILIVVVGGTPPFLIGREAYKLRKENRKRANRSSKM